MKLHVLSDLHLRVRGFAHPPTDAAVVVLAGDRARPRDAVAWALGFDTPVLYVAGNHEFYGGSIDTTIDELRRLCDGTRVRLLDNDEALIGGVRFLGSTLWTDFALFGDGPARTHAVGEAQRLIRDFSRIRDVGGGAFTPEASALLFERNARWLDRRLALPHDGPTVVITHHAPSARSVHPRFAGSPLNACFVSNAEALAGGGRASLWIHGHTHDSFDYRLDGTRIVCNPRGYVKDGVTENARFDPHLLIDV